MLVFHCHLDLFDTAPQVYCAGRSTRAKGITRERDLGDAASDATLEGTCEAIAVLGGQGVAVATDVGIEGDVEALVDQIRREQVIGREVVWCSLRNDVIFRAHFFDEKVTQPLAGPPRHFGVFCIHNSTTIERLGLSR